MASFSYAVLIICSWKPGEKCRVFFFSSHTSSGLAAALTTQFLVCNQFVEKILFNWIIIPCFWSNFTSEDCKLSNQETWVWKLFLQMPLSWSSQSLLWSFCSTAWSQKIGLNRVRANGHCAEAEIKGSYSVARSILSSIRQIWRHASTRPAGEKAASQHTELTSAPPPPNAVWHTRRYKLQPLAVSFFKKRQAQNHTSHILHSDRAGGTTGTCSASGISAYLWIALETSGLRVNGTGHYRRGNTPILGLYLHTLKGQHRGRAAAAALTLSSDALTFIGTWAHERTCGRTSHKRALMIAPESLEEKSIRFSWYTLRGGFIFVFCYFRSKAARF